MHQLREMSSLRLQLALERRRNAGDERTGQADDESPEEALCARIKELEEERNLLLSKIEVQEVQHQVQLEDAYRDHASRLQEQRVKFEEQIAEIRSRYEQLLRQKSQGQEDLLPDHLGLWSDPPSLTAEISTQAQEWDQWDQWDQPAHSAHSVTGGGSDVSTPASHSTGGTVGRSVSEHVRSIVWAIIGLIPNAAAAQCTFEDLVIEKATARAGAMFSGMDLIGMSFFTLLRDKSNSTVIKRMMQVNQSMADSRQSEIPSFIATTLGRFGLAGMTGHIDGVVSMAHLPSSQSAAGTDGRHVILVISEQQQQKRRGDFSVASSDICPSDSVSVGKRRPQFMTSELQRSSLKASFFEADSRMSAVSGGHSSPRNSLG